MSFLSAWPQVGGDHLRDLVTTPAYVHLINKLTAKGTNVVFSDKFSF